MEFLLKTGSRPLPQIFHLRHESEYIHSPSIGLVCLFEFYGISTFVGNLTPNPFLYKKQFYFKQLSLHSLIVKNISISSYSF